MISTFDSTFENSCTAGDCSGWNTKGFYEVKTDAEGAHQLHLTVNINSPQPLDPKVIKGSWFLATTNHRAELFGCRWMPFSQESLCKSAMAQKDLNSWSKEKQTWKQTISWEPDLWVYKNSKKNVESNQMTMEAVREFDLGDRYTKWKLGDKHAMVVRFVYHDRRELAGESDKIVLDLTEKAVVKGEVDREGDILPGVTTVVEKEAEPVVRETEHAKPSGTTWPIQMEELGSTPSDSKLTLSPAIMIVSGVILVSILLMVIGSAVFCCRRNKDAKRRLDREQQKARNPQIIIDRATETHVPKEECIDMEDTQNPITQPEFNIEGDNYTTAKKLKENAEE